MRQHQTHALVVDDCADENSTLSNLLRRMVGPCAFPAMQANDVFRWSAQIHHADHKKERQ